MIYFIADDNEATSVIQEMPDGTTKLITMGMYVKIGRTSNHIKKRIVQLQTGNPRPLKLMGFIKTEDIHEDKNVEKSLHQVFCEKRAKGEWYELSADEVLEILQRFPYKGFISISQHSLKFMGCDRDGIPEFGETWDWGDIPWDDCCPYCGCLSAFVYEEEIMMYVCINCNKYIGLESRLDGFPFEDENL